MNSHMKSAKHVKVNRTSFVSQHFYKGLRQIGETEMLSRVNFGRKKYLMLSCLLPNFLILTKKSLVFNFYTKCKLLKFKLSLKFTKYFKVCFFYCMFYLSCVLFLIHRSELKYYQIVTLLFLVFGLIF